ncbi:MAG TPA: class I SAM-dependent methyltransferase [Steroidobacteraceae bacterium]|nr:class I SAM-dependent methyltransferase [Steroidobacteraceae bacterium]
MTTLTRPPLSTLLEQLFIDADRTQATFRRGAGSAARPGGEDYKKFYTSAKDVYLAVSRETATLLYMLVRHSNARNVVEFGTSFGISTLHLAAGVRDNGGGRVIGTEFEPSKVARARANMSAGGLADLVEIRDGDALETLARDLPHSIDLVLLDGAKSLYLPVLALLEPKLRVGALIVADNADMCPQYVERVRKPGGGYLSVPIQEDVELSLKLGE